MTKILITGGTGLIGTHLVRELEKDSSNEIALVTRRKKEAISTQQIIWDIDKSYMEDVSFQADLVIHLAGENIGEGRWSAEKKARILESRVKSVQLLKTFFERQNHHPNLFIGASAVGYYPFGEEVYEEESPAGTSFLSQVTQDWEMANSRAFKGFVERFVLVRLGIVLSKEGGPLPQMATPVKWGLAAPLGNGKQYMPWIHMHDLVNGFLHIIREKEINGVYNFCSPEMVPNKRFMKLLAQALKRPMILPPVPSFVLRLLFGGKSQMVLKGQKVSVKKFLNTGFTFKYPILKEALNSIYKTN